MPTEIVSGPSNAQEGRININDLNQIIDDFDKSIALSFALNRPIKKISVVSVPVVIVQNLLDELTDEEKLNSNLNIRFGVTLPDQNDCIDGVTDVSNHLTVALLLEKDGEELKSPGDSIITAGFKESGNGSAEFVCCPVIKPPRMI